MKLPQDVWQSLRCPVCTSALRVEEGKVVCTNATCRQVYPVVNGVAVLLNEQNSLFSVQDFTEQRPTTYDDTKGEGLRRLRSLVPDISLNVRARRNFAKLRACLLAESDSPLVLVVGGSTIGEGMESIVQDDRIRLVETDVAFGERTAMICDSHDIPYADGTFDGVIVQAVLEHVLDPARCVGEIHRVLKPNGYVYAETPFMQQVHMGRYDFTRFTHLGHRRLFRAFCEIDSGAVCGPGMALAWAYQYFLLSFTKTRRQRWFAKAFAGFTSFYLKYFDYYLVDQPAGLDAASGYYFLGRKSDQLLPDRELVRQYQGAIDVVAV
jgi:SAM-dependent methyltransferase/uncharacterized protein YbaR (Trm112 family)